MEGEVERMEKWAEMRPGVKEEVEGLSMRQPPNPLNIKTRNKTNKFTYFLHHLPDTYIVARCTLHSYIQNIQTVHKT